ncbi:MAG: calcium-translocating P-type ATPase, PMCA-type [Christensenellaceae bacterium]|jgi:Ca2+-transporting ATPase|nr:calcium-translocating P-type ATPase, PMCA-type [Christensenellaceae bacterium]
MPDFHNKKVEEVYSELGATEEGLSDEEAKIRLKKYGENKLPEIKKPSMFLRFIKQFKDIMIIILVAAAVVSLFVGLFSAHGDMTEVIDAIIIIIIVLINAFMGLVQEMKAENAMESLKKMSEPTARVIRGGKRMSIPTHEIVVGDTIVLEAGDIVPADILLTEIASLRCSEAALTGESGAARKEAGVVLPKKTPIGDRRNMCFSGSTVAYGRGVGIAVATGVEAEIGKIATMLGSKETDKTPLEKSLVKLGGIITISVLAIAAVIFAVDIFVKPGEPLNAFLTAVALAVAAIPESLPAVVTIILSLGVMRLAKKNVIIKRLHAVETLGCCDVICSDKTGTITQNKMTVREVYLDGRLIVTEEFDPQVPNSINLLKCMTLCNDSHKHDEVYLGDPTETALAEFAEKFDYKKRGLEMKHKRLGEIPFDSQRKLMSTANIDGERVVVYTKGAADEILKRVTHIIINGTRRKITDEDKQVIMNIASTMGHKALRVLGYAISDFSGVSAQHIEAGDIAEKNLTFVGLSGMMDPPRAEVEEAIKKCKTAGMKAVMITGDHMDTAYAIAKELKMIKSREEVIEGAYLDKFNDEELKVEIVRFSVFARVSPEHKVRIVRALRANGKVVAMTGDGVNDAPSIKSAHIGIGMGITGTEVTKEVADMVLTDDNFATIVVGVEEGRKIFSNIQKTIQFLLSCNIAEVLVLFSLTLAYPELTVLLPIQILFINLVTDTLPAVALGMENAERNVMMRPPRRSSASIIGGRIGVNILYQGIFEAIIVVGAFMAGLYMFNSDVIAATMVFISLNLIQILHMFNVRTTGSVFKSNPFKNKMFWIAFIIGLALIAVVCFVPFMSYLFQVAELSLMQWIVTIVMSLMIIPVCEIVKFFQKLSDKRKAKEQFGAE